MIIIVGVAIMLTQMVPTIAADVGRNWTTVALYAAAHTEMLYFAITAVRRSQRE